MARLIDAMRIDFDEVDISGCTDVDDIIAAVEDLIDKQPAVDAVEVVRCKDCKHYKNGSCNIHSVWPYQYSPGYDFRPDDDDFCSYGERKNNGQA